MAKSVITKIRRKKMADASRTGKIARITHVAVGDGGVDGSGEIFAPLADDVRLRNELLRKEYSACRPLSDTSYEYDIKLDPDELVGKYISELMLIDEDGDAVAFLHFLPKGKDDAETTFSIEDYY